MPLVKLYAGLRKLAETKELPVNGETVRAVLNELAGQNPLLGSAILNGMEIRPHVVITLNGHNVVDLDIHVSEPDVIAIFPPIAGGTSPLTPLS